MTLLLLLPLLLLLYGSTTMSPAHHKQSPNRASSAEAAPMSKRVLWNDGDDADDRQGFTALNKNRLLYHHQLRV